MLFPKQLTNMNTFLSTLLPMHKDYHKLEIKKFIQISDQFVCTLSSRSTDYYNLIVVFQTLKGFTSGSTRPWGLSAFNRNEYQKQTNNVSGEQSMADE
jgi:hypothetical protein